MPYHVYTSLEDAVEHLQDDYPGFVQEGDTRLAPLGQIWEYRDTTAGNVSCVSSDGQWVFVGIEADSVLVQLDRRTGEEVSRLTGIAPTHICADGNAVYVVEGVDLVRINRPNKRGWLSPLADETVWRYTHDDTINSVYANGEDVFFVSDFTTVSAGRLAAEDGSVVWLSSAHGVGLNGVHTDGILVVVGGVRDAADADQLVRLLSYEDGTELQTSAGSPASFADAALAACFDVVCCRRKIAAVIDDTLYVFGTDMVVTTTPGWTTTTQHTADKNRLTIDCNGNLYVGAVSLTLSVPGQPDDGAVWQYPEDAPVAPATLARAAAADGVTSPGGVLDLDCDGFGVFVSYTGTGARVRRLNVLAPTTLVAKLPEARYRLIAKAVSPLNESNRMRFRV